MSKIYQFYSKEQRYDEASTWIARLDRTLTSEEKLQLKRWLAQHPGNSHLLLKMADLWDRMDAIARLSDLFPQPPVPKPSSWIAISAAASVLFAALLGLMLVMQPDFFRAAKPQVALINNIYETALGERSNIDLPDGTKLVLNTNSFLKVKYTKDHRVLMLERGEVHIQVAHDKSRPLSVYVEGKIVQAVGTAFALRIGNDRAVKLLVTDGKVLVVNKSNAQISLDKIKPKRITDASLAVIKGETVLLGEKISPVEKIAEADIEAELSWRQGNLVFRGETLDEAIAEISRYTSVEFDFSDNEIRDIRIAGLFKAGDIQGLLTALDKNFGISSSRTQGNRVLLTASASLATDSED